MTAFLVVSVVKIEASDNIDLVKKVEPEVSGTEANKVRELLKSCVPSDQKETLLITAWMISYGLEWYWKRTHPEDYALINDLRYCEALLDGDQQTLEHLRNSKLEAYCRSQIADWFCPETNWNLWSDCARRFLWEIPGTIIGRYLF